MTPKKRNLEAQQTSIVWLVDRIDKKKNKALKFYKVA